MHVALSDADPATVLLQVRPGQPEPLVAPRARPGSSRASAVSGGCRHRAFRRRPTRDRAGPPPTGTPRAPSRSRAGRARRRAAAAEARGPTGVRPRTRQRRRESRLSSHRPPGAAGPACASARPASPGNRAGTRARSGMGPRRQGSRRRGCQNRRAMPGALPTYAVVTPVRDEADHFERTAESMVVPDAPATPVGRRRRRLHGRHARDRRALRAEAPLDRGHRRRVRARARARGADRARVPAGLRGAGRAAGRGGEAGRRPLPARALLRVGRADLRARCARGDRGRGGAHPAERTLDPGAG